MLSCCWEEMCTIFGILCCQATTYTKGLTVLFMTVLMVSPRLGSQNNLEPIIYDTVPSSLNSLHARHFLGTNYICSRHQISSDLLVQHLIKLNPHLPLKSCNIFQSQWNYYQFQLKLELKATKMCQKPCSCNAPACIGVKQGVLWAPL